MRRRGLDGSGSGDGQVAEVGGGLLWTRYWTLKGPKKSRNFLTDEKMAYQEGLFSLEFVKLRTNVEISLAITGLRLL